MQLFNAIHVAIVLCGLLYKLPLLRWNVGRVNNPVARLLGHFCCFLRIFN